MLYNDQSPICCITPSSPRPAPSYRVHYHTAPISRPGTGGGPTICIWVFTPQQCAGRALYQPGPEPRAWHAPYENIITSTRGRNRAREEVVAKSPLGDGATRDATSVLQHSPSHTGTINPNLQISKHCQWLLRRRGRETAESGERGKERKGRPARGKKLSRCFVDGGITICICKLCVDH